MCLLFFFICLCCWIVAKPTGWEWAEVESGEGFVGNAHIWFVSMIPPFPFPPRPRRLIINMLQRKQPERGEARRTDRSRTTGCCLDPAHVSGSVLRLLCGWKGHILLCLGIFVFRPRRVIRFVISNEEKPEEFWPLHEVTRWSKMWSIAQTTCLIFITYK